MIGYSSGGERFEEGRQMKTHRRGPRHAGRVVLFAIFLSPLLLAVDDKGNSTKYLPNSSGGVLVLKKTVRRVVVDTSYFTGNYPPEVLVEACGAEGYPSPAELASTIATRHSSAPA